MSLIELPLPSRPEKGQDEFVEVLQELAHKFSQPLTCLRGSVEVALMGEIKESECRKVLEQALEESHRIAEILEKLRDVLDMGSWRGDVQPVSWRQSIERALEDAATADRKFCAQFFCDIKGEVWVQANPYHLDMATRRFIGQAIKEGRPGQTVRVELSVLANIACLSIRGKVRSLNLEFAGEGDLSHNASQNEEPGVEMLDWWILSRTVERQGGWLKISRMPGDFCYYELRMPIARSRMACMTPFREPCISS